MDIDRCRLTKYLKQLTFLGVAFSFLGATFFIPESVYIGYLPPVEISEYGKQSNIYKADSVVALAMLLNRECPTCSYEEKVYWASCTTYGVSKGKWKWKQFVFNKGQFWNFNDKRLRYNPKNKNHQENLDAVIEAWTNPKPVMFYASNIDDPLHYKQVKRNAVWKGYHYYSLSLK